ncbi:MAG: hypothetical protein L0H26_04465, partial [Microlunatus sp.]|nr:hypothetical protein [Microlunatus sp.]
MVAIDLGARTAAAAVRSAFDQVYTTDDNGAISIVGNSQMTCTATVRNCTSARSGSGSSINNNSFVMSFIDADSAPATTNSTSADLALPAGSEVLYARLVWGTRMMAGGSGSAATGSPAAAKFRAPGASAYTTITAGKLVRPGLTGATDADPYQAGLDVTATVRAAGSGTYWFANLVGATGSARFGGWSLIVAYRNPSLPLRNLTVFDGYADITTESPANSSVTATVSGFLTPAAGTVNATVGLVAWEGDLGTTGDTLRFNNTTLSDAQRPSNNTFSSRISNFGSANADRNPSYSNNLGVDMGRVSANGVLSNGQTSADVRVSTSGDYIYLGALTTEIDLYTPSFVGVSKSVVNLNGNSPAKIGDTLEYRLSFTNSGQDFADAVVVSDPLPAGVAYVPGSLAIVSGANSGSKTDAVDTDVGEYVGGTDRLVRVRLGTGASRTAGGTLAVNASTAVTFRVTLDRAAAGRPVTNGSQLNYQARTLDRSYRFITNTVATSVQEIADLAITKASAPTSQAAGGQVTYTLTVTNNGPNTGTNLVATDTLPSGATYVRSNPPSGTTCSVSRQTVTCRTESLAVGSTLAIPIVADLDPTAAVASLVDQASITADTADDVTSNNTATATTAITRNADLVATKTAPPNATAGSSITYTLGVRNAGPSTATSTTLTDGLPVGLTLVSLEPSAGSCSESGATVICNLGTLAPSATARVTVTARILPAFTGTSLANEMTASSSTPDANPDNNVATARVEVRRAADVALTKTVTPTSVVAGKTLTYLVTATNKGPSDAATVNVTDPVPAGIEVISATVTQGTCTTTTTTVSCQIGTLTPGSSARVSIAARALATTPAGSLANTATVATATSDTDPDNDSATAPVTVQSQADLSLSKTATPNPVVPGSDLTYTITTSNAGPSVAREATIIDTLPTGTAFVGGDPGCEAAEQTITCTIGTVAVGDSVSRQIVVSTPDDFPGPTLDNTARVTSDNDPESGNNTATFTSSTNPSADLAITKATSPSPLVAGGPVTYTLTVANNGPSAAQGVSVVDDLPAAVSLSSATATGGGGGSCGNAGQRVTCSLGDVSGGATVTITIVGTIAPATAGRSISNTATVSSTTPADPTTSNNSATSTTEIGRSADVGVTLTALTPTVRAGEEATYRVDVINEGPSTALNVLVTGQVPDGMEPVTGSSGGACTVTGRTVSCAIGSLSPGATESLTFRALVLPSTPAGPIDGTAYIGATTPDPVPANN